MSSNRLKISIINMKFHLFVAVAFCVALCVLQAEAAPGPIPVARFARQAPTEKPGNLLVLDLSLIADFLSNVLTSLLGRPIKIG
ncbi:hypothetical protein CDAR_244231 [Caerostris darwini]|uniref:Uncharacterized protein n=1 Tax=Caerostris darwini TaxID=1538125 RepID=A0AAV4RI77_9ARAC|nr:hypothetical protein CDAR_244231 [Caerostris darwini]